MPAMSQSAGVAYESRLPEWQRWLNSFCENWIFAFLVAMAIRHFAIELFRIPTASMEPMLYGDPGFFTGDQVLVNKLTPRFTGYTRWDVTVFQFPRPELEWKGDARPALNAQGDRLDQPLLRPLYCRNFVKRLLAVPGDTFYFFGGDLLLKQPDGSFAVARKPAALQEALWQDIYRADGQAGYLPWAGSGGSSALQQGTDGVAFTLADQPVLFTQALRNVYVKPGKVGVARLRAGETGMGTPVPVSMTAPVFQLNGEQGNLWDLDSWRICRLTTRDLDSGHPPVLNEAMTEFVGDLRLVATVAALDGTAAIEWSFGAVQRLRLELSANGWRMEAQQNGADDRVLGSGSQAIAGARVALARIDGQMVLTLGDAEVLRADVPLVDPTLHRPRLGITGSGRLTLTGLHLQRDLHYCAKGALISDAVGLAQAEAASTRSDIDAVTRDKQAENVRLMELVRSQFRGRDVTARERSERWGVSPETAVTVPAGCYLLMGDNAPFSWDGRYWGWVTEENLRGKALAVIFPPARWRVVR
jgi:signal peptidase I